MLFVVEAGEHAEPLESLNPRYQGFYLSESKRQKNEIDR